MEDGCHSDPNSENNIQSTDCLLHPRVAGRNGQLTFSIAGIPNPNNQG